MPFRLKGRYSVHHEEMLSKRFLTIHDHLHVVKQTVDDLHGLC